MYNDWSQSVRWTFDIDHITMVETMAKTIVPSYVIYVKCTHWFL